MWTYLKHFKTTGTVVSTSASTVQKILNYVDFQNTKILVELGAGEGPITRTLVQQKQPDTKLYVFEILPQFANTLKKKYITQPNVHIIQDSADKVSNYLPDLGIDYCISVLPLSIMNKKTVDNILIGIADHLNPEGVFIQLQYTRRLQGIFERYFKIEKREYHLWNIPPAHLYIMKRKW
ncbi:MAG: methyltransferase domain-containing protein [Bacteroidia bacterium]|nr:methyltransferase domain-containing protein [Bacteroidia bacterium]MDW8346192.1 methyltransferase domain-containing protein [Bacteroidia bacterium]